MSCEMLSYPSNPGERDKPISEVLMMMTKLPTTSQKSNAKQSGKIASGMHFYATMRKTVNKYHIEKGMSEYHPCV